MHAHDKKKMIYAVQVKPNFSLQALCFCTVTDFDEMRLWLNAFHFVYMYAR